VAGDSSPRFTPEPALSERSESKGGRRFGMTVPLRLLYAAMKDDTLSKISDLKDRLQSVRSYL